MQIIVVIILLHCYGKASTNVQELLALQVREMLYSTCIENTGQFRPGATLEKCPVKGKKRGFMSRIEKLVLGSVAAIVLLQWLKSNPRCGLGCQTQLEHMQEHVVDNLIRGFLA